MLYIKQMGFLYENQAISAFCSMFAAVSLDLIFESEVCSCSESDCSAQVTGCLTLSSIAVISLGQLA